METIIEFYLQMKELLSHHALFSVGILLAVGYFLGKLVSKIKLPSITGYIIAGLLLGDTFTGIVPHHMGESLQVVTEVALSLIAITIGGEFYLAKLKRLGKEIVIITLFQLGLTFLAVTIGLSVFKMDLPFALLLGAIASATAPAATVAIVQSLRAHGKFVDYLYGVVALDDAGCVIIFGFVFAFASGVLNVGEAHASAAVMVSHAFLEVLYSILLGGVSGFLLHITTRKRKKNNEIMILSVAVIFLCTAIAIVNHFSPLLANMAAGAVLINLSPRNHRIFRILEPLTPPVYALFFVIAGTELQPLAFITNPRVLLLGIVYILSRAVGKYGGVYLGCLVCKTKKPIRKYLGFSMLPQAGVAIGLVLMIQASPVVQKLLIDYPGYRIIIDNMVNVVLFSVFVNEMAGPPLSKMAIIRGNEMEV